jgi:hypothetical protein
MALAKPPPARVMRPSPSKSGSSLPFVRSRATTASPGVDCRPRGSARWPGAPSRGRSRRPEINRCLAAGTERLVQRAVRVQPREGDPGVRLSRQHDLAVRLERPTEGGPDLVPADIDPALPTRSERGVERAVGPQTRNAKGVRDPPPPATTILPLGCTRTTRASSVPPKLIVFFPVPAKLVSTQSTRPVTPLIVR